jgi:hypothetical protein
VPDFVREVETYEDAAGRSDVTDAIVRLGRSDPRAARTIRRRIDLLRQQPSLGAATRGKLVKQATGTLYVLRVQSGPVAYRLPFFESPCHAGKLVVLTHCEHRSLLRGDRYKRLLEAAEKRRRDWIRRNCPRSEP